MVLPSSLTTTVATPWPRRPRTYMFTPGQAGDVSYREEQFNAPTQALVDTTRLSELRDPNLYGDVIIGPDGRPIREVIGQREVLSADAANREYGIWGLSFDGPVTRDAAEEMLLRRREQEMRQAILAQAEPGLATTSRVIGSALLALATDPLIIASGIVPVAGKLQLFRSASRAAQVGNRLTRGAIEGAAAVALVEPIVLYAAANDQREYGLANSFLNIAFGAALGGGLYVMGGAIGDALARRATARVRGGDIEVDVEARPASAAAGRPAPARRSAQARASAMGPHARQDTMRTAVGDLVRHGEVRAADARMEMADLDAAIRRRPSADEVAAARSVLDLERAGRLEETIAAARQPAQRPRTMMQMLAREGGVRDQDGEFAFMGIDARRNVGFVNNNGLSYDAARELAQQRGFLPEDADINDFLDAVRAEAVEGRPTFRAEDETRLVAADAQERFSADLDQTFDRLGVTNPAIERVGQRQRDLIRDAVARAEQISQDEADALDAIRLMETRVPERSAVEIAERSLDDLEAEMRAAIKAGALEAEEMAEFDEIASVMNRLDGDARGYEAAGFCLNRIGGR